MRTEIEGITNENQKEKSVDSSFLWKMIELKIREQSARYAKTKTAKMSLKEKELERAISIIQRQIESSESTTDEKNALHRELESKTRELEK